MDNRYNDDCGPCHRRQTLVAAGRACLDVLAGDNVSREEADVAVAVLKHATTHLFIDRMVDPLSSPFSLRSRLDGEP